MVAHAEGGVPWRLGRGEVWEPGGPSGDRTLGRSFLTRSSELVSHVSRGQSGDQPWDPKKWPISVDELGDGDGQS